MSLETTLIQELEGKLKAWKPGLSERSVGTVEKIADGIARISGLPEAIAGELLHIETSQGPVPAMVLNLEEAMIGAVTLGAAMYVEAGQTVLGTGKVASVPVGPDLVGRVVNALGDPIDGKGAIKSEATFPLERVAPGVITRQAVNQPLQTGIKAIDAMIPVGRGQRELIIGDRGTGKTAVAIDTMIAQKDTGVVSIYVAIGQKESKIARLQAQLEKHGVLKNTIIVVASASDPASMQYLAPYAGAAIGEWFLQNGRDALIIYDDLSKHAAAYREISLLLRRPPGREAYPGDVFYLHSRLLERSARVNKENGGGSLTALPIIETQAGDISAYIPTNVISITDGQIFLETDLFYQGVRPAINTGLSVSRVGGAAQIKAMKKVAGQMRLELAQYRELAAFAQFGSDLDEATKSQIEKGRRLTELLKQPQYDPVPAAEQVILLYAGTRDFLAGVEPKNIQECSAFIREQMGLSHPEIAKEIAETGELSAETEEKLKKALTDIVKDFRPAKA